MNITNQIAQVDEKLSILRESWMDSKPAKKAAWMAKIDAALDERSKLMKIRDGIMCNCCRSCTSDCEQSN